jgi:hypothetical protein
VDWSRRGLGRELGNTEAVTAEQIALSRHRFKVWNSATLTGSSSFTASSVTA